MKIINLLSTLGLIISFYFVYSLFVLGFTGPSYYPQTVTLIIFFSFLLSYLFNLVEARSSIASFINYVFLVSASLITLMFSVLSIMGKVYYPNFYGIRACYIEFILLLYLIIRWYKKR
jgi:hypothetical protein